MILSLTGIHFSKLASYTSMVFAVMSQVSPNPIHRISLSPRMHNLNYFTMFVVFPRWYIVLMFQHPSRRVFWCEQGCSLWLFLASGFPCLHFRDVPVQVLVTSLGGVSYCSGIHNLLVFLQEEVTGLLPNLEDGMDSLLELPFPSYRFQLSKMLVG